MDYILFICVIAAVVLLIVMIVRVSGVRRSVSADVASSMQDLAERIRQSDRDSSEMLDKRLAETADLQDKRIRENNENIDRRLQDMSKRISDMAVENEQKLDNVRKTMETRINALTEDNNRQLDKMRETVDEKLQKTLNDRISKSFELVNQRLQDVTEGIGAMKNIAKDVNGLSNVLSNVKTRGILGEVQLGAILKEILSPDQYEENVNVTGRGERVEFAVKFPGEGSEVVYLPIDSKFPGETYQKYRDAVESGDKSEIEAAGKALDNVIKSEAKDISTKYIEPPKTTDFAIMFLPFEGLYAEVINRGFVETLQRDYKVVIAGPTTMSALLNSLQMGFKTLAIQKHTSEVWDTLAAVKTEFGNFQEVLTKTQKNLDQASDNLGKLIGTRTRKINKKLEDVSTMSAAEAGRMLGTDGFGSTDDAISVDFETKEDD
ncbi:MAG: DNA recombination protein RmuC [Anaerovoracaceae bacterium]|jgi:DNA recombination protein RmuC